MGMKITLSIIKADVGGFVGHSAVHPEMHELAETHAAKAKKAGLSDPAMASKALKPGSKASKATKKQAVFAKNAQKW